MTQQANIGEGEDGMPVVPDMPVVTFMSDILKIFPSEPSLSRDDQSHLSKKRRHGEISGLMKDLYNVMDKNPEMFEVVKECLDEAIVKGRGERKSEKSVQRTGDREQGENQLLAGNLGQNVATLSTGIASNRTSIVQPRIHQQFDT
ncbi:MAG: hypothetical protein J3R72DRAFT_416917 [Linnemannia gamsii]|nr:MAG: hypothetical protein J3R72DRAFT_416917 [Linnemannia gamsii]